MEETTELEACPFCGGEAIMEKVSRVNSRRPASDYAIRCNSCNASTRRYFSSKQEAVKAWNMRFQKISSNNIENEGNENA
jgi:Lar family restriction alleviation protein